MTKHNKIILNLIYVFLWMGVIYYFSDQPSLKSDLAPTWDLIFRKIAHMSEYFVLTFLVFRAGQSMGGSFVKVLLSAGLIAIAYAFSDEWHQNFVFGRHGSLVDVGIDSIGVLAFILLRLKQGKNF